MIIGEAPGERGEDIHKLFSDKAGKLLDKLLKESGLSRDDVYITNVVHCRPPGNRTPTRQEIKACRKYLGAELDLIKPKYVLLLGNIALQGTLGHSGITKYRGKTLSKDGITYLPTFHPAAGLRKPDLIPVIKTDIGRWAKMVRGELITPREFRWRLVNSSADLQECLTDISISKQISFDIETSDLDPRADNSAIYCLGIGTPQCNWVVPFFYPGSKFSSNNLATKVYEAVHTMVIKADEVIAHNGKFDNHWLRVHFGKGFPLTFDTMLAAYLLEENSPHGLKYLSSLYFEAPEYELPQPVNPKEVSLEKLARYCAFDTYYTLALYSILKGELEKDRRINQVFRHLLMPASNLFEDVEGHGVYVDLPQMGKAEIHLSQQVQELESKLTELAGKEVNWNSPQQVAKVLYSDLQLPIVAFTKTGNPSTSSEEALPYLLGAHPIVETLLQYREKVKLTQFISSWKEKVDPVTQRMHPTFKLHGTVTGRISCEEPNLQQVPRDVEIRSLITAPPGWVLVEADYSQVELRVAACLAREEAMRRIFQTGGDIHTRTAMVITGLPADKIDKDMRKKAKAINFGFVYGMGSSKFKMYAKAKYGVSLTDDEAQEFRDRFFELYPELKNWHNRQREFVHNHGYVRTPIGRKRNLPGIASFDKAIRAEAERAAVNSPVQSAASDLNLFAAIRVAQTFPEDVKIVATVHDAILMEVKEDRLNEILPQVKEIMEDREAVAEKFGWDIPVPLEVEIKVGPWGKGKIFASNNDNLQNNSNVI